jgi:hypothetical protein
MQRLKHVAQHSTFLPGQGADVHVGPTQHQANVANTYPEANKSSVIEYVLRVGSLLSGTWGSQAWRHGKLISLVCAKASEEVRRPFQLASLDEPVGRYVPDQDLLASVVRDGSFSAMLAALLRGNQLADNATLGVRPCPLIPSHIPSMFQGVKDTACTFFP